MKVRKITPLFPYQEECLKRVEELNGRALIAMEMGCGKTLCALTYLHRHPEIQRCLVVCPATGKWNWEAEASRHLGMRSEVLSSRKPPKRAKALKKCRLLIINYDVLAWWLDWLLGDDGYQPDLVVFDESHYLIHRETKRCRAARVLGQRCRHALALTGTPLVNRPAELWPTLNLLRPDLYPSFYPYAMRYTAPRKAPWGWVYNGASNMGELHERLIQTVMFRKRKEEVLAHLPPKTIHLVPVPVDDLSEYEESKENFLGWLRDKSPGSELVAAKAEKLAQMAHLKRLAAEAKMPYVLEWIDNFLRDTDEKLLLFGFHRSILDKVQERFRKLSVRVDGSITGVRRQQAFDAFNVNRKVRLLIGNIDAAGVVWSCRSTSSEVFIELPFSPAKLGQAIDRCHGVGRGVAGQKVQAWILAAKGTIEEDLCRLHQRKQKIFDSVVDGGPQSEDFNLFDKLMEAVERQEEE